MLHLIASLHLPPSAQAEKLRALAELFPTGTTWGRVWG